MALIPLETHWWRTVSSGLKMTPSMPMVMVLEEQFFGR